jgi:hypothetical protein
MLPEGVRFDVYYRDVATGRWVYCQESPSFAASSTWARMTWDAAPLPAEAAELTAGVPDGQPLEAVRVVFLDEAAAREERRALLEYGLQVFYIGEEGEPGQLLE